MIAELIHASLACVASLIFCQEPIATAPSPELAELRKAVVQRYLEPAAHLELARYYRDPGQRLLAFYICEGVRRTKVAPVVFDATFGRVFLGKEPFDDGEEAERRLLERVAEAPADIDAQLRLADVYISREQYEPAERTLR